MTDQKVTEQLVEEHQRALFGDDKTGEIGMVEKVNDMHQFFMGARASGKVLMWFITTLGLLGLAISQIGHFISYFFSQKQ